MVWHQYGAVLAGDENVEVAPFGLGNPVEDGFGVLVCDVLTRRVLRSFFCATGTSLDVYQIFRRAVVEARSLEAVMEDVAYSSMTQVRSLWPGVGCRTLVVRARLPLVQAGDDVMTVQDRDAFLATAPRARGIEIEANHYGVIHHPDTIRAVEEFLQ